MHSRGRSCLMNLISFYDKVTHITDHGVPCSALQLPHEGRGGTGADLVSLVTVTESSERYGDASGRDKWVSWKGSEPENGGHGIGLKAVVTALKCWSSRNIWTTLSDQRFSFFLVLCGARSWSWWSPWSLLDWNILWFSEFLEISELISAPCQNMVSNYYFLKYLSISSCKKGAGFSASCWKLGFMYARTVFQFSSNTSYSILLFFWRDFFLAIAK